MTDKAPITELANIESAQRDALFYQELYRLESVKVLPISVWWPVKLQDLEH